MNIRHNSEKLQDPRWATVAGLCLYGLQNGSPALDLGSFSGAKVFAARWLKSFLP